MLITFCLPQIRSLKGSVYWTEACCMCNCHARRTKPSLLLCRSWSEWPPCVRRRLLPASKVRCSPCSVLHFALRRHVPGPDSDQARRTCSLAAALVFCGTKKGCEVSAKHLARALGNVPELPRQGEHAPSPAGPDAATATPALGTATPTRAGFSEQLRQLGSQGDSRAAALGGLVEHGVAFHHAGVPGTGRTGWYFASTSAHCMLFTSLQ